MVVRTQVTVTVWVGDAFYRLRKDFTGTYLFGDDLDAHLRKASPDYAGWEMGFVTKLPPLFEDDRMIMPPDIHGKSWVILTDLIGPTIEIQYRKVTEEEEKALREKVGGFCEVNKDGVQVVSTTNAQDPVGHGG